MRMQLTKPPPSFFWNDTAMVWIFLFYGGHSNNTDTAYIITPKKILGEPVQKVF